MKFIAAILLTGVLFSTSFLFAQSKSTGSIKGKLIDSTQQQNIRSATISILNKKDSSILSYGLSKEDGTFMIENIPFGSYLMQISFLGIPGISKEFSVSNVNPEYNAGIIIFYQVPQVLGEVIVRSPLIIVNGDTTEFNASLIKTIPNATAEDLLKKLPGVEVEKDGTVKAQGETVTRVLVDGKRFFGNDPKMATKNLPAEIIDKIQVIDALSEQSVFSGFDDGNRVKTINIITKKDRKKGIFGRGSVAAGNEGRVATAVSANRFSGNQQISFIAQGNNINNQNFSIQDFLGSMNAGGGGRGGANISSGNSSGISTTIAGGLNYNDLWGKKTLVNSSYFYNKVRSTNNRDRFRETFVAGDSSLFNTNQFFSKNTNQNHRFNFEIDHRFDSLNSLLITPGISFQENDNSSTTNSYTTKGKLSPLNDVRSTVTSANQGYNFNNSILFRHRFKKRGRTFSVNFTQAINSSEREGTNHSFNNSFVNGIDTLDQVSNTKRDGKSYGVNVSFTERITLRSQVELTYNYNHNENNSDQQTFELDNATGHYDVVVPNLTNFFENTNISHRAGIHYRVQLNPEWNYSMGMAIQHAELTSHNLTKASFLNHSFNNLFPAFQVQYRKTRAKNLRFSYRGSTQQPNINQLQDVIDNSNVLYIRSGNPALKQEFTNIFNLNYNTLNLTNFKSLFINLSGNVVSNKIANTNTINATHDTIYVDGYPLGPGAQFSKPQNLSGAYFIGGSANYSLPIKKPKSTISFNGRANYSRDVNLVNSVKSYTSNYLMGTGLRYTLNLEERFDLNFSSNSTWNFSRYSAGTERNANFFTQRFSVEPTYFSKSGWIISNDFDYVINRGQSSGFNQSVPLWNAGIAKLFLKKKEAELRLTFFDILNQNKNISRNVEQNYIEDVRTQVLNRYFLVSFTYHLRKFKGPIPAGRDNFNNRRGEGRDRPMRNRN